MGRGGVDEIDQSDAALGPEIELRGGGRDIRQFQRAGLHATLKSVVDAKHSGAGVGKWCERDRAVELRNLIPKDVHLEFARPHIFGEIPLVAIAGMIGAGVEKPGALVPVITGPVDGGAVPQIAIALIACLVARN
jgi:hypothetical protein